MNSQDQVVSFMDLLDLDEEIIDNRLKSIMKKDKHTNKHLSNAIYLLQYKQLVNLQDNCDCENDEELEFAAKLIKGMNEENISNVCQIVANILGLNSSTLVNNSEHLLQQMLADIDIPVFTNRDGADSPENNTALLNFKISDSILDTVIKKGEKVALPFLELPLKGILHSGDEKLKIHFLTNTVPKFFEGVCGYNILDNIWKHVKGLQDNRTVAFNVLSALSEYFLPVADSSGKLSFQSEIVYQYEFWDHVFHGLLSSDPSLRKISMYLAKRALDCVIALNKNICVKSSNNTIFTWDHSNRIIEKVKWDNFFILIDSLEEKQSNIVLPSLQLFGSLKSLGNWLNCAFNIGLKHDNTQVRLKCIQHRLDIKLESLAEATVLLEALNDINIYDNEIECEDLKNKLLTFILDSEVFVHVFTAIPDVKWSPVPFYHITSVLSAIKFKDFIAETNLNITKSITDILKVPCNHIAIRKAIFVNITDFIGNNCSGLHWRDNLSMFCILQSEIVPDNKLKNPLMNLIPKNIIKDDERALLFKVIFDSHLHIDFGLLYLKHNLSDLPLIIDMINLLLDRIKGMVSRQYSDKSEHLQDLLYLMQFYMKTNKQINSSMGTLNSIIAREFKTILCYILSLLSSNIFLTIDEMNVLSAGFTSMSDSIDTPDVKETLLQLYKTAVLLIKDRDTVLETKVLSMFLISSLTRNTILLSNYKHEMLSLKEIISLTLNFDNKQSVGRLRNMFYEKSCEIVVTLMKCHELNKDKIVNDVAEFVDNVIECGGYGCLRHCIHIMNAILPFQLENESLNYNITLFINRIWKEIEELKSNNQYNPCIEEFVNLITHDELLKRSMYNNIVILYCNKIVEYGSVKPGPLYNLVKNLYSKDITPDNGQLIYVLCEILLYAPVPRKDQRIVENLVLRILQEPKSSCSQQLIVYFNYQIQSLSLLILTKINNEDILSNIEIFIKNRMNEVFKNKQRYHGHSQAHRLLLTALQHLLLISALKPADDEMVTWCIELLGRLPHQPSVRICLEWYIAICFYKQKKCFNQELLETIAKVPIASQFMIIYWTAKHRIQENLCLSEEYDFVMDVLLSHTMGQMFNIRLNAQYLATKLYEVNKRASSKYAYTINVIEKTFIESGKDKNFIKLQQDYFVNSFDIVNDFTPAFIYYFLPRICEINNNEYNYLPFVKDILKQIKTNMEIHDFFKKERRIIKSDETEIFTLNAWKGEKNKVLDDVEESATIQKKYVPWKNMNDVNVYEPGKKKKNHSDLIVVASLIDKLPNLGGMARTSEVFGVKTYVVDSLRHLQDKQFQGLSVSAERWIDVEEVRPGQPLKQYLLQKKAEGYSVVAAEQTSTSAKLQNFKFPKKTLLLLGHEKEGIPCDLLPMMDYCVEIPQQGFVRSLNVHVTAAIFVWEYARQNIL